MDQPLETKALCLILTEGTFALPERTTGWRQRAYSDPAVEYMSWEAIKIGKQSAENEMLQLHQPSRPSVANMRDPQQRFLGPLRTSTDSAEAATDDTGVFRPRPPPADE